MSPDPNIGRVSVDVKLDDRDIVEVRKRIDATFDKAFNVKLNLPKREVTQLRAATSVAFAKPFDVKVVVSKRSVAALRREVATAFKLPFKAEVLIDDQNLGKAQRRFQDFHQKVASDRAKIATKSEADVDRIEAQGREARQTAAERGNQARLNSARRRLDREAVLARESIEREERIERQFRLRRELAELQHANRLDAIQARTARRQPFVASLRTGLDQASRSLNDFDRFTTSILRTSLTSFTVWSTGVAAALGVVSGAAIANFARIEEASVRAGAVFTSDAFAEQLERTGRGFDNFGERAVAASRVVIDASNEIALQTIFNPAEIAAGAQAFAQAGLSIEDTLRKQANGMSNLAVVTRFAQNEQLEIADATERLVGGLNAAGLETSELTSLTDKFTAAANATNATAAEIADAFSNQAAGAFRAYGQSVDETIATISLFAKANLRGREAGTQTAIVLREITNAITNKAPEAFEKYGIAIQDAQGRALPFTQTLVQFANAAAEVEKEFGQPGVARFRKELGLTERSMRGLLILTPQLQKLGEEQAAALVRNSANAMGATARQSEALTQTISVQFGNFIESIGIQLQRIGDQAAPAFKRLLDQFNGPGGLFEQVQGEAVRFGQRLGDVFDRVANFVQTDNFRNGVKILGDAIKITIQGVTDAFREFANAFGGVDEGRSAFESFAITVRGFAEVSARVLPVVARTIGQIINFLIENADAFEVFAKITLSIYALRKAYGLFIAPVLVAISAIDKLAISASGVVAKLRLVGGVFAAISAAISFAVGFVQGFVREFRKFSEGRDSESFNKGLEVIIDTLRILGDAIGFVLGKIRELGEFFGGKFATLIGFAIELIGRFATFVENVARDVSLAFQIISREVGDFLSSVTNKLASFYDKLGRLPGETGQRYRELSEALRESSAEFDSWGRSNEAVLDRWLRATGKVEQGANRFRSSIFTLDQATGKFVRTTDRNANSASRWQRMFGRALDAISDQTRSATSSAGSAIDDLTRKLLRSSEAAREAFRQARRDLAVLNATAALPAGGEFDIESQGIIAAEATAFDQRLNPLLRSGMKALNSQAAQATKSLADLFNEAGGGGAGGDTPAASAVQKIRDLSEEARLAVLRLTEAQRNRQSNAIAAQVARIGEGYRLTRREIALLESAMPRFEKALESQRAEVQRLDDALNDLRNTQLKGTQAFSDAAFQFEQDIKKLQLQRLDLIIGGATEEDTAVAALDEQISSIQQQAERLSLAESLELDPLRRQLEQTFNPVKELAFADIIAQFRTLTAQQTEQAAKLADQERVHAVLNATLQTSRERFQAVDDLARAAADAMGQASSGAASLSRSAGSAATNVGRLAASTTDLQESGARIGRSVATGVGQGGAAVRGAVNRISLITRNAFAAAALTTSPGPTAARTYGFSLMTSAAAGVMLGWRERLQPALRMVGTLTAGEFILLSAAGSLPKITAFAYGESVMASLEGGMRTRFGGKDAKKGTIAYFLHVEIPELIRQLKGPVAYDATILVPAGEAIMAGLDRGLRSGFGPVESFLRDVGPSMEEHVPESLFGERVGKFMVDVAMGKTPDPYEAFKDLIPAELAPFSGILDPTLSFLHPTMSLKDTEQMAAHLGKLFKLAVTSVYRSPAENAAVGGSPTSQHVLGQGADLSGGNAAMNTAASTLYEQARSAFKQIIFNNRDYIGGFPVSDHMDHVHLGFKPDPKFSLFSGKIGAPSAIDIPGAPDIVDAALSAASKATGVPIALLASIAKAESGFNPRAGSPAGAQGLMQLMPATARSLGVSNIWDPAQNALGGAKYIKQQLAAFGNNTSLALAAYNAGPGNAHVALTSFSETIAYVRRVLGFLKDFGGFRADGGPVQAGRMFMVGERGPELFAPRQSGQIIPNHALGTMQGGVTYEDRRTFQIHTNASDPEAVLAYTQAHSRSMIGNVNLR